MRQSQLQLVVFGLLAMSCAKLQLNVGSKSKTMSETQQSPSENKNPALYTTWNSMEDYLGQLDKLRTETADQLMERYRADGREKVRLGFRRFRDAITKEASREEKGGRWSLVTATKCVKIEQTDLMGLADYGDLKSLLDRAYISRIKPEDVATLNAGLTPRLDEVTKLAFFEFGINLDGSSSFQQSENDRRMASDLRWKVVHEIGEPETYSAGDDNSVKFGFARQQMLDGHENFTLDAYVGKGISEMESNDPAAAVSINYRRYVANEGPYTQTLDLRKGLRTPDGVWKDLRVSRRISMSQDKKAGDLLFISETVNYGLPGEITRSFRLKLGDGQLCAETNGGSSKGDGKGGKGGTGTPPSLPGPGGADPKNPPTNPPTNPEQPGGKTQTPPSPTTKDPGQSVKDDANQSYKK